MYIENCIINEHNGRKKTYAFISVKYEPIEGVRLNYLWQYTKQTGRTVQKSLPYQVLSLHIFYTYII